MFKIFLVKVVVGGKAVIAIAIPGTPVIQNVDGVSQWIYWYQVDKYSDKLVSYAGDSAILPE